DGNRTFLGGNLQSGEPEWDITIILPDGLDLREGPPDPHYHVFHASDAPPPKPGVKVYEPRGPFLNDLGVLHDTVPA
ncbi:MAG: hypothetical protein NTU83_00490, partial [Candidatus Hydrogenedentes bacterium]|nr:hypothetical protein [Candidatus Hydrogenedentota bacterium]